MVGRQHAALFCKSLGIASVVPTPHSLNNHLRGNRATFFLTHILLQDVGPKGFLEELLRA